MNSNDIQQQLRADAQAFDDAATTADKMAALRVWMVDISTYVVAEAQGIENMSEDTDQAQAAFRKLQRQLLIRHVIWNPRLLELLND